MCLLFEKYFSRQLKSIGLLLALVLLFPSAALAAHEGLDIRTVRVGVYQNAPKIFFEDGRISGIFGDMLSEIANQEGWVIDPVPCTWNECLDLVQRGEIDIMPDVAFSEQRAEVMTFGSVPALYSWSILYRSPEARLETIHDLDGKRVAVLSGSVQERYLEDMLKNYGLQDVQLVSADSLDAAFRLVAEDKADAVASNKFFGSQASLQYHLHSTAIFFDPVQLFFVTSKADPKTDLLTSIDHALFAWEADANSAYYAILAKWNASSKERVIPDYVWWAIGGLVALLAFTGLLSWLLRREVVQKTRSLDLFERRHDLILDSLDAAIYIKDKDHRYVYVNKSLCDLFGRPADEIIGKTAQDLVDPDAAKRILASDLRILCDGERYTGEETRLLPNGETQTFLTVKQPLRDASGQVYAVCGISTDFTERKRYEDEIQRLALFDALTGLPNRTLLLERADHALERFAQNNSNGALMFIDLDDFKVLNDTLGHVQGDRLLQQVAERLRTNVEEDATLARLGGDEFVLLVEDLGEDRDEVLGTLDATAGRLLYAIANEPYDLGHSTHRVSVSIGIALISDAESRVEELLKRADLAMYEAKASGRNQIKYFDPKMQASLGERAEIEADLHEALRLEEFALVYQPQVNNDGRVFGAEALVRWDHPTKGRISPAAFIPLAETTGQIIPLGNWILREACRQIVLWQNSSSRRHLILSVNVSARQFHEPDFVANLTRIIEETGANPRRLELELTESVLSRDVEGLVEKMKTLRTLGVRFSLDDFGTGYSSLNYLKRLPLDQLKIDQSFVRDLLADPNNTAIVRTVLALGKSLDLTVIAEGVETEAQYDALVELGCSHLQGYLFGRPGPSESLLSRANAQMRQKLKNSA